MSYELTSKVKVCLHSMALRLILLGLLVIVMKVGVTVKLHTCCSTAQCLQCKTNADARAHTLAHHVLSL